MTQLPYIKKIIDALNLPSLVPEGLEADDLICTLVRRAREEGYEVEIISGDKDLLPLVQDGVDMWDPMKEVRYDPAAIREKYGLDPGELVEVRALAGDASDNIPGVPGIGEKTALKLIARYHSLENLLAHLDEIKEKALKARLQEHADQARLSRQLTELEHPGAPGRWTWRPCIPALRTGKPCGGCSWSWNSASWSRSWGLTAGPPGTCSAGPGPRRTWTGWSRPSGTRGTMGLGFVMSEQHPVLAEVGRGRPGLADRGGGVYAPGARGVRPQPSGRCSGPVWSDPGIAKVGADLKAALAAGPSVRAGPHGASPATSSWPRTC